MLATFTTVTLAWVFFRAEDLTHALQYLASCIEMDGTAPSSWMLLTSAGLGVFVAGDWLSQQRKMDLQPQWMRWGVYFALATCIMVFWNDEANQFIYFQF